MGIRGNVMSMMGSMAGKFEFEGKDMLYDVDWRVDEGDLTVCVFPAGCTAPDLFDVLFESTQHYIIEVIRDETGLY